MEAVTEYSNKARSLSLPAFQQAYPHYFLFKHAKAMKAERQLEPGFEYATRAIDLNFDPLPGQAQVVAVKKNPDNPFPDRLTIGRATNCDVVIRLAFVSKVHAHLFIRADNITLRDNKAANSTFHNHRKLEPGGSRIVEVGDTLSFGSLDLELTDAAGLYEILRSEAGRRSS